MPHGATGSHTSARRIPWRAAAAVLLFGGLAALEISDGLDRLAEQRASHRRDLVDLVDAQQEPLAREVAGLLGEGRRHAAHLAKSPHVVDLLRASPGDADPSSELGRFLRPYLASFHELDRLRVLDLADRERFRCERMGGGVATLPASLLDPTPRSDLVGAARSAAPGEVVASALLYDASRVEVEESDRRVFHLVSSVTDGGRRLGAVVVTVYAAPLLHALSSFAPLVGTTSFLFDSEGRLFAPPKGAAAQPLAPDPATLTALLSGAPHVETSAATYFARATGATPASYVVSAVPEAVLAADPIDGSTLRTALRTLFVLAAIGLGSAFFVHASLRASRLRETELFLARIRDESEKQRALLEAAADMIVIVEPARERLSDWNPLAREALALSAERVGSGEIDADRPGAERVGADAPTLASLEPAFGAAGLERLRAAVREAARGTGKPVVLAGLALDVRRGPPLEVDARCVAIDYGGKRLVEVSLSDRTRERELERRARTAERASALGLLTAGVAHEVNNPLEGIGNYLALLERSAPDDPRRSHYLAQVRRGFQRIRDITGELLSFARPDREGSTADLARVAERAVSIADLSGDLKGVRIELVDLDRPLEVPGNEGRLEQVLLNLLINAGRVMAGRGRVRVVADRSDPQWALLAVEDEGPGIAEADLTRIFDPFFTRTGGTGLGLSVSYGIVRALGGELSAANLPADGTRRGARFLLRLPRHVDDGRPATPPDERGDDARDDENV